jgi:hypothetical protein
VDRPVRAETPDWVDVGESGDWEAVEAVSAAVAGKGRPDQMASRESQGRLEYPASRDKYEVLISSFVLARAWRSIGQRFVPGVDGGGWWADGLHAPRQRRDA